MQGVPNQTHALMEWINSAIHSMWSNAGELPDTVSKWHIYVELTQVVRELGMKQSIFNPNTQGPDDECYWHRKTQAFQPSGPWGQAGSQSPVGYEGPLFSIVVTTQKRVRAWPPGPTACPPAQLPPVPPARGPAGGRGC